MVAISAKKKRANRLNARKSTGPRTSEGKACSSQNARTHGAFCKHVVLEPEDATEFNRIRRDFIQRLRPQDQLELSLVERVAEGTWRLMRLNRQEWEQEKRIREFNCTDEWHGPWGPGDATDFGPSRQRVEQSISRALRELRTLQSPSKPADLPPSPFLEEQEATQEEDPQNEPTAETSPASPGPAESCSERSNQDEPTTPPPPAPTSSPGNPGEEG